MSGGEPGSVDHARLRLGSVHPAGCTLSLEACFPGLLDALLYAPEAFLTPQ